MSTDDDLAAYIPPVKLSPHGPPRIGRPGCGANYLGASRFVDAVDRAAKRFARLKVTGPPPRAKARSRARASRHGRTAWPNS
jgi:hypothetical protein